MSQEKTVTTPIQILNSENPDFMRGYNAGLDAALQFVVDYPKAWELDHRIIELQEQVVDETCLHLENAIRQYMELVNAKRN